MRRAQRGRLRCSRCSPCCVQSHDVGASSAKDPVERAACIRVISPRVDLCPDLFSPAAQSYGKEGSNLRAPCNNRGWHAACVTLGHMLERLLDYSLSHRIATFVLTVVLLAA